MFSVTTKRFFRTSISTAPISLPEALKAPVRWNILTSSSPFCADLFAEYQDPTTKERFQLEWTKGDKFIVRRASGDLVHEFTKEAIPGNWTLPESTQKNGGTRSLTP